MEPVIHALIIEDDPSWQQILHELLADMGLVVDVVGTLPAALDRLHRVSYRVAVVDLSLHETNHSNQDGLRVLDAIREYNPRCVPLLLTGYATVELAVSALTEHGAFTCLRKELFNRAEFRDHIREALAKVQPAPTAAEPPPETATKRPAPAIEKATPATDRLAIVVEDDAGWRDILAGLLAVAGYRTRLCAGFGEALGYLGRERFDLAVVDLSLTGELAGSHPTRSERTQAGYRLLAFTRSHGIHTIVVSGITTPDDIEQVYSEYDVYACLQKQTFQSKDFIRIVQELQPATASATVLDELTDREREVLDLLVQGMTNNGIAETLVISPNTVKRHLKAIFTKLEVNTRSAAVARALELRGS